MTTCQQCNATLIADGLTQGQQVRCVRCAQLFRLGEEKKTSADRLAWRSFWLGLSSLVFLFFTGLPAVYYGVRSLLGMRFTKPRSKDRFAALSGTMMGGCFGVFGGAMIGGFAAMIAISLLTVEKRSTPEEMTQHFSQVFENEMPPELQLHRTISALNSQHFFDLVDHEEPQQRTTGVHLVHHNARFQPLRTQVVLQLRDNKLNIPGHELIEKSSEPLIWNMLDQDIEVRKVVYEIQQVADANESESSSAVISSNGTAIQYYGICKSPFGYTGMSVTAVQPATVFTEEKIREMFATLKPIK